MWINLLSVKTVNYMFTKFPPMLDRNAPTIVSSSRAFLFAALNVSELMVSFIHAD